MSLWHIISCICLQINWPLVLHYTDILKSVSHLDLLLQIWIWSSSCIPLPNCLVLSSIVSLLLAFISTAFPSSLVYKANILHMKYVIKILFYYLRSSSMKIMVLTKFINHSFPSKPSFIPHSYSLSLPYNLCFYSLNLHSTASMCMSKCQLLDHGWPLRGHILEKWLFCH